MRLFAKDNLTRKMVKVTLRPEYGHPDLTNSNISIPAYTHLQSRTISGRLKFSNVGVTPGYVFERNE